ncbi:D-Ala-D-Ala carboxypeptidase family metallohydrolase [Catellatospora coxensis]
MQHHLAGGAVSAATAKANALRAMWRLEALRHALGDQALRVTSGFRSTACNTAAGGVSGSRHLYGDGVDLGSGPLSLCAIGRQARYHGFTGILGPGYPDHSDHIHTDARSGTSGPPPSASDLTHPEQRKGTFTSLCVVEGALPIAPWGPWWRFGGGPGVAG